MPDLSPAAIQQLSERRGTDAHVLIWITAKNRDTGLPESIGLWTGDDHRAFTISGQSRTYFGIDTVINVPPVRTGLGLQVRNHRVILPPLTDEAMLLLRGYDPHLALVELHVLVFDIDTGEELGDPVRMIKGHLNGAPEERGPKGGEASLQLNIVSSARRLTQGVPLLRSNSELQRRAPTDRGREYSDVAGEWVVNWGQP